MSLSRIYRIFAASILALVAVLSVSSCRYRYIEKPDHLLTHDEMVGIICEMACIEALDMRGAFVNDSTLAKIGKNAFIERVFRMYNIDRKTLEENNEYYSEHSREYIEIYREAMDRILAEENEYIEGIRRAEREAEEAARRQVQAIEDSITDARIRDSIILAKEDSIMSLHRVDDKAEHPEEFVEDWPFY